MYNPEAPSSGIGDFLCLGDGCARRRDNGQAGTIRISAWAGMAPRRGGVDCCLRIAGAARAPHTRPDVEGARK